jgi:hypothetical protein
LAKLAGLEEAIVVVLVEVKMIKLVVDVEGRRLLMRDESRKAGKLTCLYDSLATLTFTWIVCSARQHHVRNQGKAPAAVS